jgi:hypothetical protein
MNNAANTTALYTTCNNAARGCYSAIVEADVVDIGKLGLAMYRDGYTLAEVVEGCAQLEAAGLVAYAHIGNRLVVGVIR